MIKKLKPIIKYFYTFIILIIIYIILGVTTSTIPKNLIEENSKKSAEYLNEYNEGSDIVQKENIYKGEYIFNYTNALMLNTAYSIDTNKPMESFMLARKNYIPGVTDVFNKDTQYDLVSASNIGYGSQTAEYYYITHQDEEIIIKESFEYARYWHGYLAILRPALILFSYDIIEKLSILLFIILLGICTYLICKKINIIIGILFLLSFVVMNSFYTAGSINEVTCFIIMFCANIYILLRYKKIKKMPLLFFIIGSITNYIDLLTLPLITFAIPFSIYVLLNEKEKKYDLKENIIRCFKVALAWGYGYILTWIAKWIIVDFLYNRDIISVSLKQILYRTTGGNTENIYSYAFVIFNNLQFLGIKVIYIIAIIGIIIMLIGIIKNRGFILKNKKETIQTFIYLAIALLPFIWFLILKNHSAMHARFTHRLFIISIFTFWVFIAKVWKLEGKKE